MPACMVNGCGHYSQMTKGRDIIYHGLPKSVIVYNQWLQACKMKYVSIHARVCSAHFRSEDYVRDMQAELLGTKPKKVLKKSAVPSLNLGPKDVYNAQVSFSQQSACEQCPDTVNESLSIHAEDDCTKSKPLKRVLKLGSVPNKKVHLTSPKVRSTTKKVSSNISLKTREPRKRSQNKITSTDNNTPNIGIESSKQKRASNNQGRKISETVIEKHLIYLPAKEGKIGASTTKKESSEVDVQQKKEKQLEFIIRQLEMEMKRLQDKNQSSTIQLTELEVENRRLNELCAKLRLRNTQLVKRVVTMQQEHYKRETDMKEQTNREVHRLLGTLFPKNQIKRLLEKRKQNLVNLANTF